MWLCLKIQYQPRNLNAVTQTTLRLSHKKIKKGFRHERKHNVGMSQSAAPAIRNEVTRRLKLLKVTAFAAVAIGTATAPSLQMVADGLRTLVDGCERQSSVERTRLHPQTPKVKREPFAYAFGKQAYKPNRWVSHPWPFSGNIHVISLIFTTKISIGFHPGGDGLEARPPLGLAEEGPRFVAAQLLRPRCLAAVVRFLDLPRHGGAGRLWGAALVAAGGLWPDDTSIHYITLHYNTLHI